MVNLPEIVEIPALLAIYFWSESGAVRLVLYPKLLPNVHFFVSTKPLSTPRKGQFSTKNQRLKPQKTMAYSEKIYCQGSCKLSRQLHTVKAVQDCQDSSRLSSHLQIVKTVADRQDCCKL